MSPIDVSPPVDLADGDGLPDGLRILEQLGASERSVVYRAHLQGEDYALKVRRDVTTDAAGAQAFYREAAMLACLRNPGSARIETVGISGGRPYLLMEFVPGRSLRDVLDGEGQPLEEARTVALAADFTDALAAAHRAGLVHRDVKPENLLVTGEGRGKVIDFGLAGHAGGGDAATAVGTALYSAPEQVGMLKRPVDGRSDLYSLGVVLFECVTGSRPFESSDLGEIIRRHAVETPPSVRISRPELSPALAEIIAHLLAKDPDDRYQSGEGLLADLRRLMAHGGPGPADFPAGLADEPAGTLYDLPLVGRGAELETLVEAWESAKGGQGRMALVDGEPGAGKSRLVRELLRRARHDGALVLAGKAVFEHPVPLIALRQAVDDHLSRLRRHGDAESRERVAQAAAGSAGMLAAFSPEIAALLGDLPGEGKRRPAAGALEDHQEQFYTAIAGFIADLARESGRMLLSVDDVQWLDSGTRQVFQMLSPVLSDIPLLVVGAARCDEASRDGHDRFVADAGETLRSRVRVEPLDQRAEERLVAEMLRADPAEPDFVRRLRARSNGNPLATVEYLRAVIDAGLLRPSWGRYVVDTEALDRMHLPNDVMELVLHRADDLGTDARRMLVAAAAVGTRFRPARLGAVVGADDEALGTAVADALAARLIERLSGDECAFVHDRIREAMLEPLTPEELRRLHQRIAEALDAQTSLDGEPGARPDTGAPPETGAGLDADLVFAVARHYALGEVDRNPVKVFEWNSAAARRAMAGFAAPTAARCFAIAERAAQRAGIETDAAFEEAFGLALLRTRDAMGATHHLQRALERHPGPVEQGRIHTNLARVTSAQWHRDEAWSHVLQGLEAIGHPLPANPVRLWLGTLVRAAVGIVRTVRGVGYGTATPRQQAEIRTLLGLYSIGAIVAYIGMQQGRMSALMLSSLGPAHRLGDSEEMVRAYTDLSMLTGILRLRRLRDRLMARSEDVARRVGDPWSLARAHVWCALSYELSGETVTAGRLGARTLREEGRWLDTEDLVKGAEGFPNILDQRGHLREAHDLWFEAQDVLARDTSAGGDVTVHAWFTPLAHAGAGRRADALRTMAQCEEALEGQAVGRFARAGYLMFRLRCMVELDQLDDYPELVARFDALRLRATTASVWLKGSWAVIADAALELARRAGPQERPAAMAEARRRIGALRWVAVEPVFRAHFAAARARLAQLEGRPGRAARYCRRAEHFAVIADAPIVHFQVALVRARLADAQGHPEESRRQVLGALQLAAQHGWVNQPRRVRAEFGQTVRAITPRADRSNSGPDRARSDRTGDTPWPPESPRSPQLLHDRRNLDALLAVHTYAAQQREPEAIAKVALDQAIGLLGAERGIWFTEAPDGSLVVGAARDTGGNDLAVKDDYASTVVRQVRDELRPIVVTGTREGAAIGSESAVLHDLRSIMAAPLVQEGAFMGVVYLDSRLAKGVFTDDDLTMLSAISSHIAVSMTTLRAARLESAVAAEQQERSLAQAIQDFTTEVNASLDPAEVAERAGKAARRLLPFDQWVMLDRTSRQWSVLALGGPGHTGWPDHVDERIRTLDLGSDPFLAGLDATSRPLLVAHAAEAQGPPTPGVLSEAGSWMSVPAVEAGRLLGVSLFAARDPGLFGELQLQLAATLAAQAQSAIARARLHQEVQQLVGTDELTGVGSRRRFFDLGRQVVAQAHRYLRPTSVAMLDIDLFKVINDRYGHDAGDDVIRTIGRRLRTSVRESDVLGRYGGDEFALVLPETDVTAARTVAERLRAVVADEPVPTRAGDLSVTISIGLTMLRQDGQDLADALRDADTALYRAKAAGRNEVAVV